MEEKKMIYIGSDHRGYKLKESIKKYLKLKLKFPVVDVGTTSDETPVDYPDIAKNLSENVAGRQNIFGILVCGTGIEMAIAANKVIGARAAVCHNAETAIMSRRHNDANILCIGTEVVKWGDSTAEMVDEFLTTDFDGEKPKGERHKIRVEKIEKYEKERNRR